MARSKDAVERTAAAVLREMRRGGDSTSSHEDAKRRVVESLQRHDRKTGKE